MKITERQVREPDEALTLTKTKMKARKENQRKTQDNKRTAREIYESASHSKRVKGSERKGEPHVMTSGRDESVSHSERAKGRTKRGAICNDKQPREG